MEAIIQDLEPFVMIIGFVLLLFNQNRNTKKEYKQDIEEMSTYKAKTEKALKRTDDNERSIKQLSELTEKMAHVLEEVNRQRNINMPVEISKTNSLGILLEYHKDDSDKLYKAFCAFEDARQKADALRSLVN